jgi:histidinol-phosphate phosphatase family protein
MVSPNSRDPLGVSAGTRSALFLDRDGTIIEDAHYLRDPEKIRFLPGALAVLRACARAGYLLVLVSNQSGVARGYLTHEELMIVHAELLTAMSRAGVALTGSYYCEHGPDDGCACRKPKPGLFHAAAAEHDISLASSWVVGDKPRDCQAGLRAGCKAIWLCPDDPPAVADDDGWLSRSLIAKDWMSVNSLLRSRSGY